MCKSYLYDEPSFSPSALSCCCPVQSAVGSGHRRDRVASAAVAAAALFLVVPGNAVTLYFAFFVHINKFVFTTFTAFVGLSSTTTASCSI